MSTLGAYLADRVVVMPTGCWQWTGPTVSHKTRTDLYGLAIHRDLPKRRGVAHRVVYEHVVGPIPDGMQLDHLCRNRGCVSPFHLEPVTQQENIRRGDASGRTHCKVGHPFDEVNTYVTKQGQRQCRACKNDRQKARYQRLRALAEQIGLAA